MEKLASIVIRIDARSRSCGSFGGAWPDVSVWCGLHSIVGAPVLVLWQVDWHIDGGPLQQVLTRGHIVSEGRKCSSVFSGGVANLLIVVLLGLSAFAS